MARVSTFPLTVILIVDHILAEKRQASMRRPDDAPGAAIAGRRQEQPDHGSRKWGHHAGRAVVKSRLRPGRSRAADKMIAAAFAQQRTDCATTAHRRGGLAASTLRVVIPPDGT